LIHRRWIKRVKTSKSSQLDKTWHWTRFVCLFTANGTMGRWRRVITRGTERHSLRRKQGGELRGCRNAHSTPGKHANIDRVSAPCHDASPITSHCCCLFLLPLGSKLQLVDGKWTDVADSVNELRLSAWSQSCCQSCYKTWRKTRTSVIVGSGTQQGPCGTLVKMHSRSYRPV
jgi:hypothetical protein